MKLSKKQLEKIGTAYVAEHLYREGLRFALPDIDDGIDLIVYNFAEDSQFTSVPVQLKAFSDEEFYSDKKYLKINGLFMVYLWYVGTEKPVKAFGMKYTEVEKIVDQKSWSRHNGVYAITRGTNPLRDILRPFEIKNWSKLFFG